jgi:hypothetical protein
MIEWLFGDCDVLVIGVVVRDLEALVRSPVTLSVRVRRRPRQPVLLFQFAICCVM